MSDVRYTIEHLVNIEKRLNGATGPDPAIDAWLHMMLVDDTTKAIDVADIKDRGDELEIYMVRDIGKLRNDGRPVHGFWGYHVAGPLTRSTDAAIAMCKKVLPKAMATCGVSFGDTAWSRCDFIGKEGVYRHGVGRTPAIAIMLTMIRELIAREEEREFREREMEHLDQAGQL